MASATLNHQLSSRDVVAAAVDCGRQLLVMVSKFASPLRAVGSYGPEAARTETSLAIPTVLYRRNPSSFRRQRCDDLLEARITEERLPGRQQFKCAGIEYE